MRQATKVLTAGGLVLAGALLGSSAQAQWRPWGPYGWGAPPPVLAYEERDVFLDPFGPSWTEIRRMERRAFLRGMGIPADVPGPLGPSPTDIRRTERQLFYRSLGLPY